MALSRRAWGPIVLAAGVGLLLAGVAHLLLRASGPDPRPPADAPQSVFLIKPYLTGEAKSSMRIRWVLHRPLDCKLEWIKRDSAAGTAAEPCRGTRLGDLADGYFYDEAVADLLPDTVYDYAVTAGGEKFAGEFRTWPSSPRPFTFAAYGDSRTGHAMHRRIAERIAATRPDFVLHTGDLVSTGAMSEWKPHFFDPAAELLSRVPLFASRGNHEGDGASMARLLAMPGAGFGGNPPRWYAFEYANARFFALDRCYLGSDEGQEMLEWLDRELTQTREQWKIVFYHYPTYDISRHEMFGRAQIAPILRKHRVDLVFTGHAHSYQRFKPMFTRGENEGFPITYVVTAGGGASLGQVELSPHLALAARRHNYSLVRIDGPKLTFRTFDQHGEEFDGFEYVKQPDGKPDAAYLATAVGEEDFDVLRDAVADVLDHGTIERPPQPGARGQPGAPVRVPLTIGAGPHAMKYRIRVLDEECFALAEPLAGEVPAGQVVRVTALVAAKVRVELDRGWMEPDLRLACEWEIDGKRGSVNMRSVWVGEDRRDENAQDP